MAESKTNILCILRILQEYSDENHIITAAEISDKLQAEYGRSLDRRTVYSAVNALKEFDPARYEIEGYKDNNEGYCILKNIFEPEEIRFLIDAIFSCEYIPPEQTKALLEKLRSFLSVYERKDYNYSKIVKTEYKTQNSQILENIAKLNEAISKNRKVAFTYLEYDYDKSLKPRRDEKDVGSPYVMTCDSGNYYLIAITERHPDILVYYRIDMMADIEVLNEARPKSKRDVGLDSNRKVVYAFAGKPEASQLRCKKPALRYVIERFGNDVMIMKRPDGSFDAHFSAAPGGVQLWALQNIENVEVIKPKSVRERIKEIIKGSAYLNEDD